MKLLVVAVWSIISLTSEAKEWIPIEVGMSDTFDFDPESMAVEYEIVPKKALANLNFNLVTRFFDKSNKMLAMASFRFQMKGKNVIKEFLRLSTKKGHTSYDHCYDRKVIGGKVPENIFVDLTDPDVYLINNSKSPNFAEQKYCDNWRDMLAKEGIVSAEIALWDNGRNTLKHLDIEYRVISTETATTTFSPSYTSSTPTSSGLANLESRTTEAPVASSGDICSIYPNGVIDTFDKISEHYDLKCYHVLAASYGSPSWFIYGAYDATDGKRSCRSLAVYVGAKAFQVSRGWLINYGGEKFEYTEGEERVLADTGCVMSLSALHLTVDCRPGGFPFVVHYDGYMLAHVELFERTGNEIGLCFENSKSRVNWQIRNQSNQNQNCDISPAISDCAEAAPECAEFENSCDEALARACRELTCGHNKPTSEQICSLSMAKKKKCHLRGSNVQGALTGCPQDVCLRKYFVLNTGSPQDPFFTECPVDNYINNGP